MKLLAILKKKQPKLNQRNILKKSSWKPPRYCQYRLLLDIGDISGEIDGNERQNVFRKVWGRFGFDNKEQEQFFQDQRKDMEKLLSAAKDGIPIRIWKSSAPYSACGFYYVCHLLRNIDCNISVVSLPEYYPISENETVEYSHWGEVDAGKFYQFLPFEKQLTNIEKRIISDRWHGLMEENAPLRAIINRCKKYNKVVNFCDTAH